jgi:hypothetical protein
LTVSDNEIDNHFIYFACAYFFKWTPEEVNKIEYYLLQSLMEILPRWIKKEKEAELGYGKGRI